MYLEVSELSAGGYMEELQIVARNNGNLATAIEEAMAEVDSYLSARYDMGYEYAQTGDGRNTMVKKLVRDIAIYNAYNIGNPSSIPESRAKTYDNSVGFLKQVQSEKANIQGLKRIRDAQNGGSNYILFGGNKKRKNQWE